jgi:signal transduction histidine kinase/CheY-like chemotaxis protein
MDNSFEQRLLICAPHGKDAGLACDALEAAGFSCCVCKNLHELSQELLKGAGAVLAVEEAMPVEAAPSSLEKYLACQPTWSDMPILVLTKPGGNSPWIKGAYQRLGNLTLLERPVRAPTLISAARSALRARQRQYEIRLADQRKDEFLAMLAHELRNPLAPISAAAQLLELVPSDVNRVKQTSVIISRQIQHMTTLIDDLLDVARVTRGLIKLDCETMDMRQVISLAVEQVMPLIRTRRHHLELCLPPVPALASGDRKRLIQVVTNILNNAAKYTPEEGRIEVNLRALPHEIVLDISDNGIGMASGMVSRVFELFAQAERTSDRSQGGLGLGLALVKNLVESHGGTVHANSEGPGKGSTFTVHLPRIEKDLTEFVNTGKAHQQSLSAQRSLRVLVVDDNVDAANTLQMYLSATGHDVAVEYAGVAGMARSHRVSPEVCLIDIGLPDLDGYELARKLRTQPQTAKSLLIAITGYGQEHDKKSALAAGFDHHLVKPIDMAKLTALIESVS